MALGSGQITKREGLLVFASVAFIGVVVWYWMMPHADKNEELDVLRSRVESLTRTNQRAAADLASGGVSELQAEAESYARMFSVLRQLVPQNHEVPTLLDQIAVAARREGLELGEIAPQPLLPGPEFDTHRYKMTINGGYHAVARFLANVGALSRIVTTVDVKFVDKDGATQAPIQNGRIPIVGNVTASFEIRTYVARTEPLPGTVSAGATP
jgi:type IV pilus assembly protein PilO